MYSKATINTVARPIVVVTTVTKTVTINTIVKTTHDLIQTIGGRMLNLIIIPIEHQSIKRQS